MKQYQDRAWLYKKYIEEKLSALSIAKICGVSNHPIYDHLRKFGIEIRSPGFYQQGRTWPQSKKEYLSRLFKGRISPMKGKRQSEKWRQVISQRMHGERHPQYGKTASQAVGWKGGTPKAHGYSLQYQNCMNGTTQYRAEHRIIAEAILRRPMKKDEVVHHINGNRSDNRHSNLLICTRSFHAWLHRRIERMKADGNE
jgi:hypothetical protein